MPTFAEDIESLDLPPLDILLILESARAMKSGESPIPVLRQMGKDAIIGLLYQVGVEAGNFKKRITELEQEIKDGSEIIESQKEEIQRLYREREDVRGEEGSST